MVTETSVARWTSSAAEWRAGGRLCALTGRTRGITPSGRHRAGVLKSEQSLAPLGDYNRRSLSSETHERDRQTEWTLYFTN